MSKEFMNLNMEYKIMYENTINQMLQAVIDDNRFEDTIRHLCNEAIINNWELEKKVNIINIITNN
jgi:hypothetical protein